MNEWGAISLFVLCFHGATVTSGSSLAEHHGLIREDAVLGSLVELDIPLQIRMAEGVCSYTVYKLTDSFPFKVEVRNQTTGEGRILLDGPVDAPSYTFDVAARSCLSGSHSDRETVHIQIEQVFDEQLSPEDQQTYSIEIEEDRLYSDILQLEIEETEKTAEGSYHQPTFCQFHILDAQVPFVIENRGQVGILRNTERLYYAIQHNYILQVKAENCGGTVGRTSSPLVINIKIKPMCHEGWTGLRTELDYTPGDKAVTFADQANLNLCDNVCEVNDVSVKIKLAKDFVVKGCDKDAYALEAQRRICGLNQPVSSLLPVPAMDMWNRREDTKDKDIFSFDGHSNAVEVPVERFNGSLGETFTFMMWMKHASDEDRNDEKEHVMCNADGEEKNRHHYSVFVHHCKLVLLVRQEYFDGVDMNTFWPAEWRWKVPQVCDDQWHHYTITFDRSNKENVQVHLHIDGMRLIEADHNPQIVDDWALHPTSKVHYKKLMLGACWMGGEHHLTQHFKGQLAGVSVTSGQVGEATINCLSDCHEKLDFRAMSAMEHNMSLAFNSEMSEINIQGPSIAAVQTLVRKVGYLNTHLFPQEGHRTIDLTSTIGCAGGAKKSLPAAEVQILVLPASQPVLLVEGTTSLNYMEDDVVEGALVLPNVRITPQQSKASRPELQDINSIVPELPLKPMSGAAMTLDSCTISVEPHMDFNDYNKEHLNYPENLVALLLLEAYQTEAGLVISGAEKIENYEHVLGQIRYVNALPQQVYTRKFSLSCSQLNGRFTTNKLEVSMSILHPTPADAPASHSVVPADHIQHASSHHQAAAQKDFRYQPSVNMKQELVSGMGQGGAAGAGVGIIVIIVVCVGFLLFMVVLGVMRIRTSNNRTRSEVAMDEKPEMEWDNSALTITVNPMEQQDTCDDEIPGVHGDDSDSEDDTSDFHDDPDDCDSSEEEVPLPIGRGLEWDESDLSKYQCKV